MIQENDLKTNNSMSKKYILFVGIFLHIIVWDASAQSNSFEYQTQQLLQKLDLKSPELKTVKASSNNPQKAATELLKYFKSRTSVKHPAQNSEKEKITEKDLQYANDALEHIFVGQPAYDPVFCGDDIDWGKRPVPDNEWVWQLNRMYFWNSMAKVYAETKDEKYAKEWSEQLIHWVKNNPRDEEHKYAWRSIETGIRGYNWTGLFFRFIKSEHLDEETLVYFLNSLYEHAEFLMTVYRSNSNWGLMEAEGMAFIAITFPEFMNAEKWRTEAFRRLNNEISIQVYPDGHQRELAMGYHLGCINWFYRTYELAKMNGLEHAFPESYLEMIEKMCEVPMKICLPDGTNVQFGDAWRGQPGQHADRFLEWAKMFERDDFLYLATEGKKGSAPERTAYALPESGIYSMRSGWDKNATCLVLKCGPDGGGHCQPDNGTFVLYAGGRNLMPDAESYIYSGNPEGRRWFRQTKIHQTLTLNGENSTYAPKLLKWKPGKKTDILVVENKSYENLTHRRSVFFIDKRYFVIVDEAIGEAAGGVSIHFQLAPNSGSAVFNRREFSVQSDFEDGWNVLVKTQKQDGLELNEEEGWVSFEYTKKEKRPAFAYSLNKDEKDYRRFATLVIPLKETVPDIEIVDFQTNKNKLNKLKIKLKEKGKIISAGYRL